MSLELVTTAARLGVNRALEKTHDWAKHHSQRYRDAIATMESKLKIARETGKNLAICEQAFEFCETTYTPLYHEFIANVVAYSRRYTEVFVKGILNKKWTMSKKQVSELEEMSTNVTRAGQKLKHASLTLHQGDSIVLRAGIPSGHLGYKTLSHKEAIGRLMTYEKAMGFNGEWGCLMWVPEFVHHATLMMHTHHVVLVGTECVPEVAALVAIQLAFWGKTVFFQHGDCKVIIEEAPTKRPNLIAVERDEDCACEVFMYDARDHVQKTVPPECLEYLSGVYIWDGVPDPFPTEYYHLFTCSVAPEKMPSDAVAIETPVCEW